MKKLLSFLLVLTLLCGTAVFAQAAFMEDNFVGEWQGKYVIPAGAIDDVEHTETVNLLLNPDKSVTLSATVTPPMPYVEDLTGTGTWKLVMIEGSQAIQVDASSTGESANIINFIVTSDGKLSMEGVITLTKVYAPMTGMKLNKTKATLYQRKDAKNRDTLQLKTTITPSNAKYTDVTWKSSKPSVAKVDKNGLVTALKAGSTTITATTNSFGKTYTATCTVTVNKVDKKVTKITAKPKTLTLKKGQKGSVVLTFKPVGVFNNKVKWTTSDKKIATVSAAGLITAKGKGKCNITATATDGTGKKVTIKVTVK